MKALIFALAVALVLLAMALAREVRLRRAFERLLKLLLARWCRHDDAAPDRRPDATAPRERLPRRDDGDRPRSG